MNRHEFEVRYSERQIRRSTWAYIRMTLDRELNWFWRTAALAGLLLWCWLLIYGSSPLMVWVIAAIAGCLVLFLVVAWHTYIRHSIERLSRMKTPVARVVADDDQLTLTSDLGTASMPWATFTEWLDGPGAIYLKAGRGAMINLPTDGVDERALRFIRERIAANQPAR